jgi:diguanylate cyclase (GGDEF)-like protein
MNRSGREIAVVSWFKKIWEALVEPAWFGDARERHLSRVLNIILLFLLASGILFEVQSRWNTRFSSRDTLTLLLLGAVALAYYLNRRGLFSAAIVLTLGLFIISTFAFVLQNVQDASDLSILYYLIIAILMGDLFFSIRGYLATTAIILGGVFAISLLNPNAETVFIFLSVFGTLVGFSSYSRRSMETRQTSLANKYVRERSLRNMEQRRSAQLSLLEEVGRQIADSLDEKEILERTLGAIVQKFGYAEAVISLLVQEQSLEVAAFSGTPDFGQQAKAQQNAGRGIIAHVAKTHKAHIAADVSVDPYYFSTTPGSGSAAGVPVLDKDQLLGVIYVESHTRNAIQAVDVQALQTLANQVATSLQKARLYARTQDHLQVMTALQSVSHAITSSLEIHQILNNVIQLLRASFGYTYISVYLLEADILRLRAQLGYREDILISEMPVTSGIVGRTARCKQTQFIRDVSQDPDFVRAAADVKSKIAVPLVKDDLVLGVLSVEAESSAALDENDVNLLNALAGSLAIAIDNARLHAEVKLMAMTDVVSGLANRRAFDDYLESEMLRASRYSQPVSLIILDLDSFKEYNDKWGHPAGDVRLREIADLLRANVREPDVAARYGGEEFAVILPNTSKGGAIRLAERLRRSAEECAPDRNGSHAPIAGYTISLGVATYPEDATSLEELLLAADNAELTAKRLGKNRLYAANTSSEMQNT